MSLAQSARHLDPVTVRADEVDAFATAVAGLHIDYVRTGAGKKRHFVDRDAPASA